MDARYERRTVRASGESRGCGCGESAVARRGREVVTPFFFRSWDTQPPSRDEDVESAIAECMAVSRSPLRLTEPEWFTLAERGEWERLTAALGLGPRA